MSYPVQPEKLISPDAVPGLRLVDEIYAATLIEQLTRRLEACAEGFSVDTDGRSLIVEARAFLAKLG